MQQSAIGTIHWNPWLLCDAYKRNPGRINYTFRTLHSITLNIHLNTIHFHNFSHIANCFDDSVVPSSDAQTCAMELAQSLDAFYDLFLYLDRTWDTFNVTG